MDHEKIVREAVDNHRLGLELIVKNAKILARISEIFTESLSKGGKIIFMGNGGSAADAQHLAAEFVGRFLQDRIPLAAISLTTNSSTLTALANDFGFDSVFSRQLKALAKKPDIAVMISTSGKSANIASALKTAKEAGIKTVGFLGKDMPELSGLLDAALNFPLNSTPAIQEMHITAGHIVCCIVEKYFSNTHPEND